MKLSLGFSPCPNDTFIFDALVHNKIDTEGLEFTPVLADVEELNQMAFASKLDITKLSYHALAYLLPSYVLLDSGSALGNNCGPILIAKEELPQERITELKIGIPGKYTTANFLLSLAYPTATNKEELLFSEIEEAVQTGKIDAGLIIHENRFTYQQKGLKKIIDLGEFWENATGMPIPLGGIVIKRDLSPSVQQKVNRVLERSVRFALDNPAESRSYVREHAQEMEESVMYQHIDLYVNSFSVKLGELGRRAVELLFSKARNHSIIPDNQNDIFITM